jgi:hypothetical protein
MRQQSCSSDHETFCYISNDEALWLKIADIYTLRLRPDGCWFARGHPTWGIYTTQLLCIPPTFDNLCSKGLVHGIQTSQVPIDSRDEHVQSMRRRDEIGKAKLERDPGLIDVAWPTAKGRQMARQTDLADALHHLTVELVTPYKKVG